MNACLNTKYERYYEVWLAKLIGKPIMSLGVQ